MQILLPRISTIRSNARPENDLQSQLARWYSRDRGHGPVNKRFQPIGRTAQFGPHILDYLRQAAVDLHRLLLGLTT